MSASLLARLTLCVAAASAFKAFPTPSQLAQPSARFATSLAAASTPSAEVSLSSPDLSRRASLRRLAQAAAAVPVAALLSPLAARADGEVQDLDAPSQEEIEKARLARKLAAQNKDKKSEKKGFAGSLADEQAKEKQLKSKSKQEKREDLCELLGRGC